MTDSDDFPSQTVPGSVGTSKSLPQQLDGPDELSSSTSQACPTTLSGLFFAFARIGLFTFGGGYAMLPLIQKEVVEKKGWASEQEILDYYAIGQCTPGVIAVNTATFIGYRLRGISGAILATLGVITPSIAIITLIAALLKNFIANPWVGCALGGIRVAVTVLIVQAIVKLWKTSIIDAVCGIIFALAFITVVFLKISPVFVVLGAGLLGILTNRLGLVKRMSRTDEAKSDVPQGNNP